MRISRLSPISAHLRCAMVLAVAMLVLFAPSVRAAGTLSVSYFNKVHTVQWTSDGSGDMTEAAFAVGHVEVLQVSCVPGSDDAQPSDSYDVQLLNPDGVDVLQGLGLNLSNTAAVLFQGIRIFIGGADSTLQLVVANAGSSKSGTCYIWTNQGP